MTTLQLLSSKNFQATRFEHSPGQHFLNSAESRSMRERPARHPSAPVLHWPVCPFHPSHLRCRQKKKIPAARMTPQKMTTAKLRQMQSVHLTATNAFSRPSRPWVYREITPGRCEAGLIVIIYTLERTSTNRSGSKLEAVGHVTDRRG